MFRISSIFGRMVALAFAAALPVVCLVAYLTYERFESATVQSEHALRTATESAAYDTSRYIGRIRSLLETLAHSPLVAALDATRCEPRLAEFAASVSQAANLLTLDADGNLVCSALPQPAGTARRPDPVYFFTKAKASREFTIGTPALGFISRRWVVTLAQPILDADGRFQGVVALAVDLLKLAESRGPIGDVGATGVLGSEGTMLWQRPDPATWIAIRSTDTIRLARSFREGGGRAIDRSPQGIETLYAYSTIPGTDWFAYSSMPTELAFATARREAVVGAVVTLAALLFAMALSWLIARRIAEPIRAIADNARAILRGDVGVRIDEHGPAELVDIAREINAAVEARATAEGAMRQSEAQFRRIFDRAGEGIAVFQDGRFVLLNEAATRLAGLESPDLAALDPLSLIHPDDCERVAALRTRGRQGEPADAPQEFRLLRPDGSTCWVESRSREIDWQGRAAMLVILTDITQRKSVELVLREARDDKEAMLNALPDLMFKVDRDGRIEEFHSSSSELLYLPPSAFLGRTVAEVLPDDASRVILRALAESLERGTSRGMTYDLRVGGQTRWFEVSAAAMSSRGTPPSHGILLVRDVTERRHAAEELARHRDHLEELVETRTRELVRARDAERAANAILDLSRIDAGKLILEEGPLNIESVVASTVEMLDARAQDKHLLLTREVDPMPRGLAGDATRLRQALLNYVDNAIRFTDTGHVTVRAVLVGQEDTGAVVRFEVSDTGVGIAPHVIGRLFTAVEQADASTTRREGGTGLGLAITRRIAQTMGGDAGVDSVEGVGSTFWFTARLKKSSLAQPPS